MQRGQKPLKPRIWRRVRVCPCDVTCDCPMCGRAPSLTTGALLAVDPTRHACCDVRWLELPSSSATRIKETAMTSRKSSSASTSAMTATALAFAAAGLTHAVGRRRSGAGAAAEPIRARQSARLRVPARAGCCACSPGVHPAVESGAEEQTSQPDGEPRRARAGVRSGREERTNSRPAGAADRGDERSRVLSGHRRPRGRRRDAQSSQPGAGRAAGRRRPPDEPAAGVRAGQQERQPAAARHQADRLAPRLRLLRAQ